MDFKAIKAESMQNTSFPTMSYYCQYEAICNTRDDED